MMKTRNSALVLPVLLAFCGAVDAREPDYTIGYNLRATPEDATSSIEFTVTMGLMNEAQDGDSIAWNVIVVTIREFNEDGDVVNTWTKNDPYVDTADGFWWIEHADPAAPINSEFLVPPRIADIASSPYAGVASLEFDFEGDIYVAPPEGAPFTDTGSLTVWLRADESPPPPPKKEVSDEQVEIPPQPESAYPS